MIAHPALDEIQFFKSLDSTILEAQRRRSDFSGRNILLIADEQTAGKGQFERGWDSKSGLGLWMTLFIGNPKHLKHDLQRLSLYAGLITQRSIRSVLDVEVLLKWPNDVLIQSKKCAGILSEIQWIGSNPISAAIGIGINLTHGINDFPESLRHKATSLQIEGLKKPSRDKLLEILVSDFFLSLDLLDLPEDLITSWNSIAWKRNRTIRFQQNKEEMKGKFLGLSNTGEALVQIEDQVHQFRSGEIRFENPD